MLASLARSCSQHPWRVLAAWGVVLVVVLGSAGAVGDAFVDNPEPPTSESGDGFDLLDEHFSDLGSGATGSVVFAAEQGVADPAVTAEMSAVFEEVASIDGVMLSSPYDEGGQRLVSARGDAAGTIAYAELRLDPELSFSETSEIGIEIDEIIEDSGVRDLDGLQVEIGGQALGEFEPPESEALGLAFAVIVLILATGSVVAMGTSIGVALAGVATGTGLTALVSNLIDVPSFATTLGVMIGLGVGIDYALFIITRYREALRGGASQSDAIAVALDTSGRSVLFAGMTVVISLLGLLLVGLPFVSGLGIAAALTVSVVMVSSVTLLPAAVGLADRRMERTRWRGVVAAGFVSMALIGVGLGISPLLVGFPLAVVVLIAGSVAIAGNPLRRTLPPRREKPLRDTFWYRLSRTVQARPWAFALGGTAVLLLLALPVTSLRLGFSDEGNAPESTTMRQAYDLLSDGFGPGANGPLIIATEISDPADVDTLNAMASTIGERDDVAFASPTFPSGDGEAAVIQVQSAASPQDELTEQLVLSLRDDVVPDAVSGTELQPKVSGLVAANIDFTDYLSSRLVVFFGAVLGLSFLLLMAVFRSLLVPLKAVIMNMLSIGAAYGVVVAIYQWGWLGSVFGIAPGPIEPFIPMMLFAIVFGLSMDYEVFLLSRIKEEFEKTGDPVNSVADGLAATARVITTAAAIMVVVFGSFALEDDRVIKLFGTGLAVAVLIDASIVRMLIVPSTMELLGARNWWLPRWLDRLLPNLNVEGTLEVPDAPVEREVEREPELTV